MASRWRRRLKYLAIAAGVLSLAGVLVFFITQGHRRRPPRSIVATVVHVCGHQRTGARVSEALISALAAQRVGSVLDGWRLAGRNQTQMRLEREQEDLCPQCARKRFFGIASGRVAVFAGIPDHPGRVLELTQIRVEALPQPELADLEQGIPYASASERLRILEGLAALFEESRGEDG